MLDRPARVLKDRLLNPVADRLAGRVAPSTITASGFLAGCACAVAAASGAYATALLLWLLNRTLDGLDGAVARAAMTQSDRGGYFDLLLDFTIYATVPIAIVLSREPHAQPWLPLSFLLAAYYVNAVSWLYITAVLEKHGRGARQRAEETSITMPTGVIEGTETLIFYAAFLIFPAMLSELLLMLAALVLLTIVQRSVWAAKHL